MNCSRLVVVTRDNFNCQLDNLRERYISTKVHKPGQKSVIIRCIYREHHLLGSQHPTHQETETSKLLDGERHYISGAA